MSVWVTHGLKTLRFRAGSAIGAISTQRYFGTPASTPKQLEVAERPKRPLAPYFRYVRHVKSEVQQEYPTLKATELSKVIAQRWEHLDEVVKKSYIAEYKDELASYSTILEQYNRSLTPEQLEAQQQLKLDRQENRKKRKRLKEVGTLINPPTTFRATEESVIKDFQSQGLIRRLPVGGEGEAIKIVSSNDEHSFKLNVEALEKVLLQDDIKDLPVAVVSIAGAFRKGKSFMLDYFLRYLQAGGEGNWLGKSDVPLDGFSWRGGAELDTTGILLWSQVFKVKLVTGEEIAVLLMDTQGAFDSQSTVRDCATIFALSTMTSSVQIFNLSQNIQEDDLQHLQLFTEYGRLALEDCDNTPFQKLQFLIRDWSYPYEAAYGLEGGKSLLERRLRLSEKQHDELQSLRKHIRSCFKEISCYLMPHPGLKVATSPNFDGRLSDIEIHFRRQLAEFVPLVLHPQNLLVKEIGGNKVKAKELVHYFKAYTKIYQGNELPEPKSMLTATAEANNLSAVVSAKELYSSSMESVCGGSKPFIPTAQLEWEHNRYKEVSLEHFNSRRKMGGSIFSSKYKSQLENEIDELFVSLRAQNESKNIFNTARTPATLFSVAAICYGLSDLVGVFGLYSFSALFKTLLELDLLILAVWAYIRRYNRDLSNIGSHIDTGASFIWEYVLKPVYAKVSAKSLEAVLSNKSSKKSN